MVFLTLLKRFVFQLERTGQIFLLLGTFLLFSFPFFVKIAVAVFRKLTCAAEKLHLLSYQEKKG